MDKKLRDLIFIICITCSVVPYALCACEPGWAEYYDKCFYITDQRYVFQDYQHACTIFNATTWAYHSQDEWQWVSSLLENGPRIYYWIGLQRINGLWKWDDGMPYNRENVHWYQNMEGNTAGSGNNPTITYAASMMSYKPDVGSVQSRNKYEGWGIICVRPKDTLDLCDLNDDWHYINGRCLKFFDTPKTWYDARQTCQSHQGDLTMYNKDQNEWRDVDSLIACRTADNIVWIGLSDTAEPRTFRWLNNDTVRYSRWIYSNNILKNGSTCVAASPLDNWFWKNYVCDTSLKFICNRSVGVCPVGWLQNNARCYQPNIVDSYKKTWFDAKIYCASQGSSMLVINSEQEQQFVSQTLATLKVDRAWLGFSDENVSDALVWVDGHDAMNINSYQHWDTQFPQTVPRRYDCGLIVTGVRDSRWSNVYCFNLNPFFCEIKITAVPFNPTLAPVFNKCDPDWVLYHSLCYYFGPVRNQTLKNWGDAFDFCQGSGGNLVIIGDPYEMSFITVQQSKILTAWIGMKYQRSPNGSGQLQWVDGTVPGQYWAQETNFFPGEPNDINSGDVCIQIVGGRRDYSGSWDDGNCSIPQGFICEKNSVPASVEEPTGGPPVPNTWSGLCGAQWIYNSNENFCYMVVLNRPKSWAAARLDCMQNGGDLLSITGRTEQNFVQAILSTGIYAAIQLNFWIGATDVDQEGGWHWTDNSPFRYLKWHPGEPNNHALTGVAEDCAEMVPSWNYAWNDKYCIKEQVYICKKTAQNTTAITMAPPSEIISGAQCNGEAMISGNYSVVDMSAFGSSSPRDSQHLPMNARLYPGALGGWSAMTSDTQQYISVTFYSTIVVKGIITAGRMDTDEWVTQYKIQYQELYYADWLTYQDPPGTDKVFIGNNDSSTAVTNMLMFPFEAKIVKLIPVQWHMPNGISLRWEILACVEESCNPDYAISGPLVVMDNQLSASSVYDMNHDSKASRLQPLTNGQVLSCWKPVTDDMNQYIQADLGSLLLVCAVTVRGNPVALEWVTYFKLRYSMDGQSYAYYQEPYGQIKNIPGNIDSPSLKTYYFKSQFIARFVRLLPQSWKSSIALAFDVLVCSTGCKGIALISGSSISIPDSQLNASSLLDPLHGLHRSRLNVLANGPYGGAWIPRFSDTHQYIQADLGNLVQIIAIATQGSFNSLDWVTSYQLAHSGDGIIWRSYYEQSLQPRVFQGNWENNIVRKHYLQIPFITRYVQLWPKTWHNRIALRWELYGCPGADSGVQIGCYADNIYLRDLPYEPFTDAHVGMWPPMCINHCFRNGYYYAGVQDQFKCFCGNSYGKYGPATDCNIPCMPSTNFHCGGPSSNMIFTTGLTAQFKVCPSNWKAYRDHCYILLLDKKSWYNGQTDCNMLGGNLASPNSQQEQDFIFSLLQYGHGEDAWIGLNDIQDEALFNWVDNKEVQYTNWGLNQPSHTFNDNQDCVIIKSQTGGWQDALCNDQHEYICQMDKRPSIQPSVTPQVSGCSKGWDGYRWSCYLYADAPRTWADSRTLCATLGATLVTIDDRYEQAYIASALGSRYGQYWIGVTDTAQPGTFTSINVPTNLQFTNWAENKPDAVSQCVAVSSGKSLGLWYNMNCVAQLGLICEQMRIGYTSPVPSPQTQVLPPCDPGLIQTPQYCYQINVQPQSRQLMWYEAHDDCVKKGGDLASFHSVADIDTVWRNGLVGTSDTSYWIGLNDQAIESGYVWSDNTPVQVVNWNIQEPNNFMGREDCVEMMVSTSKWNDEDCSSRRNWICMIPRGQSRHLTTPNAVHAPTAGSSNMCRGAVNWTYYNGNCYYVDDGNGDHAKTWRQARRSCQQKGGDLASILSQNEQLFIYYTLLANVTATNLWIGLNEIDSNNGYRWSDSAALMYTNWAVNEPNDFGGAEDCVDINLRLGKWADEHCAQLQGFVCKRYIISSPTPVVPTVPWVGNCPTGFSALFNKCYRVYTDTVNWTTAMSRCQVLGPGYRLASVQDDIQNAFLTTMLADMKVSPWIGLQKDAVNQLKWISNEDTVYTNFRNGEPNGGQQERCVEMLTYTNMEGQWNDDSCSTLQGYICMTSIDTSIATPEPIPNICDVKQGQVQFQTACYIYIPTPMNWTMANDNCVRTAGGYLTSVLSGFEQAFIYVTMKLRNTDKIWTGLNDRQKSGTYTWKDGWPVLYANWDSGQPASGQGCVMINSTGKWIDTNCSAPYSSICKISSATPAWTPPPPNGVCDPGWYSFGTTCYYMGVSQPRSVLDASVYCQQHQATLISIHNDTVNQYVVTTMTSLARQGESFWTSLHKSLDSGFQWLDGSPVDFTNWRPGEPSTRGWSGNLENCGEVFLSDGKWNDEDCNTNRLFICQKRSATDSSNQQIGTGGLPINIPTPFPWTRPSVLPPQEVPTLPPRTPQVSNPQSTLQSLSPQENRSLMSQSSSSPAASSGETVGIHTGPTAGIDPRSRGISSTVAGSPSTGLNGNTAVRQQQDGVTVITKVIEMSTGSLAGIIIGSLAVIVLLSFAGLYWRRRTKASRTLSSLAFPNSLYTADSQNDNSENFSLKPVTESKS